MKPNKTCLLTINGGSSSIKLALFQADQSLRGILEGRIERIDGTSGLGKFWQPIVL